jgi:pre-rRNA-processing protein TSR3
VAARDASRARFTILRDRRESPKKCSIAHLRGFPGVELRVWSRGEPVPADGFAVLHHEGSPLTPADRGRPILLVDCSWQHVNVLLCDLRGDFVLRSLPEGLTTAYPRRSKLFEDPRAGLATIEALYAASVILGDPREDVLATYREAPAFREANAAWLRGPSVNPEPAPRA